jgi:hypothetical protein
MRKSSWSALSLVVSVAACAPVYGGAGERMRDPKPVPESKRPVIKEPPVAGTPYVEKCEVDFRRSSINVRRNPPAATTHVAAGTTKVAEASKAPKPEAKVDLVVEGIKDFSRALEADPYDADATLQLALAYDEVLRKGCALALLRRLDELALHPKLGDAARSRARRVKDNQDWFHDYRKEALAAISRSTP